ncbi:hypothetical protein EAT43_23495 [Vibrio parahaemolyticus]|nr:hypothetical protein [Vibrio parahaemolyticus]EJG1127895.1 hypothetical protein [Vibrio parahaemolyticus]
MVFKTLISSRVKVRTSLERWCSKGCLDRSNWM